jgi:hypothetical protein
VPFFRFLPLCGRSTYIHLALFVVFVLCEMGILMITIADVLGHVSFRPTWKLPCDVGLVWAIVCSWLVFLFSRVGGLLISWVVCCLGCFLLSAHGCYA